MSEHADTYFAAVADLARAVPHAAVDAMAAALASVRDAGGRLFVLGSGGGAGHASHAVNDFRKLCALESYAPTDNVSELTARINDEGWDTSLRAWLEVSRLSARDAVMIFSVGGGSREHAISVNLVEAMDLARAVGAKVFGIVGHPGGATTTFADVVVTVDAPPHLRTPLVESFQAVVWHALVSHPGLAAAPGKWESVTAATRP